MYTGDPYGYLLLILPSLVSILELLDGPLVPLLGLSYGLFVATTDLFQLGGVVASLILQLRSLKGGQKVRIPPAQVVLLR